MSTTAIAGSTVIRLSASSTSTADTKTIKMQPSRVRHPQDKHNSDAVGKAVYSHIRAIRALGHTTVNTVEIARALGISAQQVQASLGELKSKGVKIAK